MRPRASRSQAVIVRAEQNRAQQRVSADDPKSFLKEAKGALDDTQREIVPRTEVQGLPQEWNTAVPNGGTSPTEVSKPDGYGTGEAMSFAGPGPEIINGRLAMLGFVTAVAAELNTGRPLLQQWQQSIGPVIAVSALFAVASLVPMWRGANLKEQNGFFTKKAELWNGRVAMIGFAGLILTEFIKGGALF